MVGRSTVVPTYDDTDRNRHVNNIVYLNWALGSLPALFRDQYNTRSIDASYLRQTFLDDELTALTWAEGDAVFTQDEPTLFHQIVRGADEVVWEAHSLWQKRETFRA